MVDQIIPKLEAIQGVEVVKPDVAVSNCHVDAAMPADKLRDFATELRKADFMVESVSAVDATPMMAIYHFCHPDSFCRVVGRVLIERTDNPVCPTIQDIYPGANWHERETHDFFGIEFTDHPDMTMLILPEDATDQKPLLKAEKKLKELGKVIPRFAAPPEETTEEKSEGDK